MGSDTPTHVMCPLAAEMLSVDDGIPFQDISNGSIKDRNMPDKYKQKNNWRAICRGCKWQEY